MNEEEIRVVIRRELDVHLELEREKLRNIIRQEIAASMVNGWGEHRRLVVSSLERLANESVANTQSVNAIHTQLATITTELKIRSSIWGGIWGAAVAAVAAIISYLNS